MILAHHIILTGYAHWVPNDPRGSLSKDFRNLKLLDAGAIHYGRKKNQPSSPEIREFYSQVKPILQHPTLWFNAKQRQSIGDAIGEVVRERKLTCYACAVTQDHTHVVIRRHRMTAQEMIPLLMVGTMERLRRDGLVPKGHPIWSCDPYVKYKSSVKEIWTAVDYVKGNLIKHRIGEQRWSFVVDYDGWPHPKT